MDDCRFAAPARALTGRVDSPGTALTRCPLPAHTRGPSVHSSTGSIAGLPVGLKSKGNNGSQHMVDGEVGCVTRRVLALELLERTAGRRRRCRRCRSVIAENARKRGQAWSVCTPCAQAIEDDARQFEIEPTLIRRCLVCRTDIAQLRAGARTCGDVCRNVLSRLLRSQCHPVS